MSAAPSTPPGNVADREIVLSRVFAAPRELVFTAWTDPRHLAEWWGPRGFTTTTSQLDLRPGGLWRFVMHGPDGKNYDNRIEFIEIVRPERLVFHHGSDRDNDPDRFHVTATFTEDAGQTRLTMRMLCRSAEQRAGMVKFGAIEGGQQTLERLAEYLPRIGTRFVLTRVFDAPLDLVWKAWTEPERLRQWWGPKGFKVTTCKLDLRPGGLFHYCLQAPDGQEMWGRFAFREIEPRRRLVWVNSFSDPSGGVARHVHHMEWPLELLTVLTFLECDGKTSVTIDWTPHNATSKEVETFVAGMSSMQYGWTGTLDQLSAYLAGPAMG